MLWGALTYLLPWALINSGEMAGKGYTIWSLAAAFAELGTGYGMAVSIAMLALAGASVVLLVIDLVSAFHAVFTGKYCVQMDKPSVIVPTLFPILFIVFILETSIDGSVSAAPLISTVVCILSVAKKSQLRQDQFTHPIAEEIYANLQIVIYRSKDNLCLYEEICTGEGCCKWLGRTSNITHTFVVDNNIMYLIDLILPRSDVEEVPKGTGGHSEA